MQIDLSALLKIGIEGLNLSDLEAKEKLIPDFLESFQARSQGFVSLVKSKAQVLAVKTVGGKFKDKFKDIVVLGIGGSALGVNCLRDSLKGTHWNLHGSPRLFVLDNLDLVQEIEKVINLDETLFIVISKSGTTQETLAQYFYFKNKISKENFVFITDPEEGFLRKTAREMQIPCLDIPANVGGRFSVLSPVGLLPAYLLGMDIEALLEGAEEMSDSFFLEDFESNLPFQLATIQYLLDWNHGIATNVMMPYSSNLFAFAEWYAQLLAESTGKDGKGLTPISALGPRDQHSQIQLYNEGPKDKFIMFLEVEEQKSLLVPQAEEESFKYIYGKSFHEIQKSEQIATLQALSNYGRPSLNIKIPKLDEFNLGKMFMLAQASIAFLGEYYKIDAFNQPGVELGKKLSKEILSKQ